MTCDQILDVIEDYYDGELDDLSAARVASHLHGCKECSAALSGLEDETAVYRAYAEDAERSLEVSPAMWEAVRRRIAELEPVIRERWTSRFMQSLVVMVGAIAPRSPVMWQVAYSLVLVAVSVTGTLIAVGVFRQQPPKVAQMPEPAQKPSTPSEQNGTNSAVSPGKADQAKPQPPEVAAAEIQHERPTIKVVKDVAAPKETDLTPEQYNVFRAMQKIQRAEQDYIDAIKVLSAAVNKRKPALDPQLVATFDKNLAIVDRTIAQTRKAYEAHPGDPEIAQYMLLAYANKVDLLRELAY